MRYDKEMKITALLIVAIGLSASPVRSQNKAEYILKAQSAYYNIPKQGVTEFQCSITPDWASMLTAQLKTEVKPDNRGLTLLKGVHFGVTAPFQRRIWIIFRRPSMELKKR
jgi:hypothetical protein